MTDHEATAKLPCKCGWALDNIAEGEHKDDCPAYYNAEIDQLRAKLVEAQQENFDLRIRWTKMTDLASHNLNEREAASVRLEQFAKDYPCDCAENYPGTTMYHGHDCQNDVVQEFVAQFAEITKAGK